MSLRDEGPPDPILVLRTFGRIALSDFVTIVVLSIFYSFAAMSIVPIGPALLAMMDTFHASVTHTGTGGKAPTTTVARVSHFMSAIWTYLKTGLPYTVVVLLAGFSLYQYGQLVFVGRSTQSMLAAVVGIYAVVVALVIVLRGADLVVRLDAEDRPGFVGAMRRAWGSLTSNLAFAAIHVVTAIVLVVGLLAITPLSIILFMPSMLVLLELLHYEELDGAGAKAIRFAYLDPQE